jgi:serine protease AprX
MAGRRPPKPPSPGKQAAPDQGDRLQLARAVVPPSLYDPARRAEYGLESGETDQDDYLVELNLRHRGGLKAAESRFLDLFRQVVPETVVSDTSPPRRVGKSYYSCRMSAQQWRRLIELDQQPEKPVEGPPEAGKNSPRDRAVYRIWPDFAIHPLIDRSVATVKADAALRSYAASGAGITWAVLDSGIDAGHPHFGTAAQPRDHLLLHPDVADLHRDFTLPVDQEPDGPGLSDDERGARLAQHRAGALSDELGHGTHVAGIIAGGLADPLPGEPAVGEAVTVFRVFERSFEADPDGGKLRETVEERTPDVRPSSLHGVAPRCKLVSLRILPANGKGKTSDVIRALDYIRENLNDNPKLMRVHGVNLSVGYEFDAEMFACGQSPLCVEVDRLVQSGVVVVAAAGNTGYGSALSNERTTRVGLSNTINDPGNAALAITVGATHRDAPHTYGVSYFSSKGPTGDGRLKPDLVAPGERITSCAAGRKLIDLRSKVKLTDLLPLPEPAAPPDAGEASPPPRLAVYQDLNGTSMAAPHVSGAIAAFLSIRREFIGKPLEVKRIFLANATTLGRERYFEGHGLVDLMRAIQSV